MELSLWAGGENSLSAAFVLLFVCIIFLCIYTNDSQLTHVCPIIIIIADEAPPPKSAKISERRVKSSKILKLTPAWKHSCFAFGVLLQVKLLLIFQQSDQSGRLSISLTAPVRLRRFHKNKRNGASEAPPQALSSILWPGNLSQWAISVLEASGGADRTGVSPPRVGNPFVGGVHVDSFMLFHVVN